MACRLAFDTALAGGVAPWAVQGALEALERDADLHVLLVGPGAQLRATLPSELPDRITVVNSGAAVDPERDPAVAVRARRDASIRVATGLLAAGEADALVTVGPAAAALTAALFALPRTPGLRHPVLAATVVVDGRRLVIADAGAAETVNAGSLVRYAELAAHLVAADPVRVGLLAPRGGSHASSREAAALLGTALDASSGARYVGAVTASEALGGAVDVLVGAGAQGALLLDVLAFAAGPAAVRPEAVVLGVDGLVGVHTGPHDPTAAAATLLAIGSATGRVETAA